jgi:uridine kinase
VTDEREIETVHIEAKPVILVEGIPHSCAADAARFIRHQNFR